MRLAYSLAVLLAVPAYWPRLVRSLWLDEAGTYWMAQNGFREAIERTAGFNGQSILYSAIASWFCVPEGPWMEFLLRLPSVAGLALLLYFTARLGSRALGPSGGLCAFVLLLFHPMSLDVFAQARPYSLAAAAVAGSYWVLLEWVQHRHWRWAAGYSLAVALVWYLHYLYVVALGPQVLYLAWVFLGQGRRERWAQILAAWAAAGLLVLPLAGQMLRTAGQARELSVGPSPDPVDWAIQMFAGPMPLFGLAIGLIAAGSLVLRRRAAQPWPELTTLALWGAWWLFAPALLFLASQGPSLRLFLPRYLGSSSAALAVLLAAVATRLFPPRFVLGGSIAVAALLGGPLGWRTASRPTGIEALPPISLIRAINPQSPPPVFFHSNLIESNALPWRKGPEGTHAFGELAAYPIPNRVYGLPVNPDADVEYHVKGILDGELASAPLVVVVKGGPMPDWILREMEQRGYSTVLQRPNAYSVGIFRRNPLR